VEERAVEHTEAVRLLLEEILELTVTPILAVAAEQLRQAIMALVVLEDLE
jgi:hypothetical protein